MPNLDRDHPSYPYSPHPAQQVLVPLKTIVDHEGLGRWELWRLFLRACHTALDRLPSFFDQAVEVAAGQREASQICFETEEETAQWRQEVTRHFRYHPDEATDLLAQAFGALLNNSATPDGELTYADTIGTAYMEFFVYGRGNGRGQYFTPWNVAYCMAQMSFCGTDWEEEMRRRFVDGVQGQDGAEMLKALALAIQLCGEVPEWKESAELLFWDRLFPAWRELVKPYTICDPACGSGILLLAAAKSVPRGLIDLGMVQFYGVDIDPICVEMARLNMRLYGIIPLGIQPATLELLSKIDFGSPYQELYTGRLTAEMKAERDHWQEGIDLARQGQLALWDGLDELAMPSETRVSIKQWQGQGQHIPVKTSHPEALQLPLELAPGDADTKCQ